MLHLILEGFASPSDKKKEDMYYTRPFNKYNVSVYDYLVKTGHRYFWDQCTTKRASNEITYIVFPKSFSKSKRKETFETVDSRLIHARDKTEIDLAWVCCDGQFKSLLLKRLGMAFCQKTLEKPK